MGKKTACCSNKTRWQYCIRVAVGAGLAILLWELLWWLIRLSEKISTGSTPNSINISATPGAKVSFSGQTSGSVDAAISTEAVNPDKVDAAISTEAVSPDKADTAISTEAVNPDKVDAATSPEVLLFGPVLTEHCTKIYVDVGCNRGMQLRKLFEPHLYPNSQEEKVFAQELGDPKERSAQSSISGLCAFGFEADQAHAERLKQIQSAYRTKAWRIHIFVPSVVSTVYGKDAHFYTNGKSGKYQLASIYETNADSVEHTATSIDLAEFLERHIVEPAKKAGRATTTIMKFDLEELDNAVIRHLLKRGLLCRHVVKMLITELHPDFPGGITMDGLAAWNDIIKQIQSQTECTPSLVQSMNDERYWEDGAPLPQPI